MVHPLDPLFQLKSIAMVGTTETLQRFAQRPSKSLVDGGFQGRSNPIRPRSVTIRGRADHHSLKKSQKFEISKFFILDCDAPVLGLDGPAVLLVKNYYLMVAQHEIAEVDLNPVFCAKRNRISPMRGLF